MGKIFSKIRNFLTRKKPKLVEYEPEALTEPEVERSTLDELSIEELLEANKARMLSNPDINKHVAEVYIDPVPVVNIKKPKRIKDLEGDAPLVAEFRMDFKPKVQDASVIYHMPNFSIGLHANEPTTVTNS